MFVRNDESHWENERTSIFNSDPNLDPDLTVNLSEKGEGPDPKSKISSPDPWDQIISDSGGSRTLVLTGAVGSNYEKSWSSFISANPELTNCFH